MTQKKLASIDLMRVLAMFGVLSLHTLLAFTQRPDLVHSKLWWLLEPVMILSSFAVPIFFLISGYLTLTKQVELKQNLRGNLIKLGIPLLFFTILRGLYLYFFRYRIHGFSLLEVMASNFSEIMSSQTWFLVYLLIFRLLQPLWQLLFKTENKKLGVYLLRILTVLVICSSLGSGGGSQGTISSLTTALFFYLLGGGIKIGWWAPSKLYQLAITVLFASLIIFGRDFLATHFAISHQFIDVICKNITIFAIPSLFYLLLQIKTYPFTKMIAWLAKLSFGIYLWQEIVVMFRRDVLGFEYDFVGLNPYLYCFANYCLVFGSSLALTWLTSRIPKVKTIVGF